ncbi:TPR-like protein [Exidia glandulosa HHB12029]|uniref:TPR-like protein n=1 Tax=Exidia glandulosa HHB12029 TaxID=1314781 RepID=A0A166A3V6_EXIGL|nr:TPR-like protein [Exidia glandulosa HHB12029]
MARSEEALSVRGSALVSVEATALKEQGNALFRARKYNDAYDKYADALKVTDQQNTSAVATLRANRAQCCLMLQRWEDAKLEAAEALVVDIRHAKSWHRLGKAYLGANGIVKAIQVLYVAEALIQDEDGQAAVAKLRKDAYDAYEEKGLQTFYIANAAGPADVEKEVPLVSASPHTAALAARLEAEGRNPPNRLFAYAKYTLALVFDPTSVLLHVQRAQVANQMGIADHAGVDARTAIRLDSSNAEAWTRLGTALYKKSLLQQSTDAFNHALFLLETAPQPPGNSELREQLVSSLGLLRRAPRPLQNVTRSKADVEKPWDKAERLLGAARNFVPEDIKTWHTSFWTIVPAHKDFAKAFDVLCNPEIHPSTSTIGSTDAIEYFANAILIELRSFGANNWPVDFNKCYKVRAEHELLKYSAFTEDEDGALFDAVKARLRQQGGWGEPSASTGSVRKSLETTIRARVVAAFLHFSHGDLDAGISIFEPLLSFLEKGRKEWRSVPSEERGPIFDLPFLLGVEKHYIDCLRRRYTSYHQLAIPDAAGYLEQIKALAEKMLKQVASLPAADRIPNRDTRPPSYVLGYIILPEAWAHDALRFYYYNRSLQIAKREDKVPFLIQAAAHAAIAETLFPDDDERHTVTVHERLTLLFLLKRPLRETLPVCDKLAESYRKSREIWDYGFDLSHYTSCHEFAEEAKKSLCDGKVTLNDVIVPKDLDSQLTL